MRQHGGPWQTLHARQDPEPDSPTAPGLVRRPDELSSLTVRRTVVWTALRAPPAPMAIAVAAVETISGASHRL
jgi:hypothetical protein